MNPGTGGLTQRRARPRPNDCTLPAAGERVARAIGAVAVGAGLFLIARAAGLG